MTSPPKSTPRKMSSRWRRKAPPLLERRICISGPIEPDAIGGHGAISGFALPTIRNGPVRR